MSVKFLGKAVVEAIIVVALFTCWKDCNSGKASAEVCRRCDITCKGNVASCGIDDSSAFGGSKDTCICK
jgi:hypothetical protein